MRFFGPYGWLLLLGPGMLGAACASTVQVYHCERATDCDCDDPARCEAAGRCEENGLCSFPDAMCLGGSRYGQHSGALSGECLGAEAVDAGAEDAAIDPGLLAWFRFEEGASPYLDSSGHGHQAQCTGTSCPTQTPGQVGQALLFDGVDDHLRVEDDGSFSGGGAFSVAIWVRTETDAVGALISKPVGGANDNSWQLEVEPPDRLSFTGPDLSYQDEALTQNVWAQVVATWDGSTKGLYVDGTQIYSFAALPSFDMQDIVIGADFGGNQTVPLIPVNASLDEVRVYDRALSQSEISAL